MPVLLVYNKTPVFMKRLNSKQMFLILQGRNRHFFCACTVHRMWLALPETSTNSGCLVAAAIVLLRIWMFLVTVAAHVSRAQWEKYSHDKSPVTGYTETNTDLTVVSLVAGDVTG